MIEMKIYRAVFSYNNGDSCEWDDYDGSITFSHWIDEY